MPAHLVSSSCQPLPSSGTSNGKFNLLYGGCRFAGLFQPEICGLCPGKRSPAFLSSISAPAGVCCLLCFYKPGGKVSLFLLREDLAIPMQSVTCTFFILRANVFSFLLNISSLSCHLPFPLLYLCYCYKTAESFHSWELLLHHGPLWAAFPIPATLFSEATMFSGNNLVPCFLCFYFKEEISIW